MSQLKEVTMYSRGVSLVSGTGGYGVVLLYGNHRKELSGRVENASNNQMDIVAAIEGLKAIKFPCKVIMYNNNTYLIDAFNKGWIHRWQANGWINSEKKPIRHRELWKILLELCSVHEASFLYIKADFKNQDYKCCDRLARSAAQ